MAFDPSETVGDGSAPEQVATTCVQPNAGLPRTVDGRLLSMATPEYFDVFARRTIQIGATMIGGCCGTTPEHVRWMAKSGRMLGDRRAETGRTSAVRTADVVPVLEPTPLADRHRQRRGRAARDGAPARRARDRHPEPHHHHGRSAEGGRLPGGDGGVRPRRDRAAIGRLEKKKAAGAEIIMTQPIFQPDLLEEVLRRIEHVALPVMVGVLPLVSYLMPPLGRYELALEVLDGLKR